MGFASGPCLVKRRAILTPVVIVVSKGSAITTPTRVKLITVLVPHLAPTLSSAVLSPIYEAFVEICPDKSLVQLCAANVLEAVKRVLMIVIFHEAEAAGCLLETIQPHDYSL